MVVLLFLATDDAQECQGGSERLRQVNRGGQRGNAFEVITGDLDRAILGGTTRPARDTTDIRHTEVLHARRRTSPRA
jgi:hypothetical protein